MIYKLYTWEKITQQCFNQDSIVTWDHVAFLLTKKKSKADLTVVASGKCGEICEEEIVS